MASHICLVATRITQLLHWTQKHLLWLLLLTYVLGALAPGLGLRLRSAHLGTVPSPFGTADVSVPVLMLGFLLVVAGLGAKLEQLRHVMRRPSLLVCGFTANAIYPIIFTALVSIIVAWWHSVDEA